jgi:hypothetical protein
MSDPTVRFTLREKDLRALVALAAERNQTVSRTLRSLVRDAIHKDRKADNFDNEHRDEAPAN